ncbi:MAG: pyridoxamine 5'-phosphate oxidase [Nitrospinaceae bacterium]|nr:pyridoxamine 5'-phosphate oxidase [Nitrospinaceae bacterium]
MKTHGPPVTISIPPGQRTEPYRLFWRWYQKAEASGLTYPNGMTLATVTADGQPSARIVLLKQVQPDGFVFFTNYRSRKGRELAENPNAALVFWWPELKRQIRICGSVTKVPAEISDAYFQTRPRGYKVGAWASEQSRAMDDRFSLAKRFMQFRSKFGRGEVPRPPHWGGYRLEPVEFEFWEERVNRLHERRYFTPDKGGTWRMKRLFP